MDRRPAASFMKNAFKLAFGSSFAQLLGLLVLPILTRIFAPDDFGIFAIFISLTGLLGVVACLRYEMAIMLPERDEDAANIGVLCIGLSLVVSLVLGGILAFFKEPLFVAIKAESFLPYVALIPVSVFFFGLYLSLNYWNTRFKRFGGLAKARIVQSSASQLGKLLFGLSGMVAGIFLVIPHLFGQVLCVGYLFWDTIKSGRLSLLKSVSFEKIFENAKRYRHLPLYGTWSALLNTASNQVPLLILAYYFTTQVVGYFSLSFQVLSLPMLLLGTAVGQVFFQRATEALREGALAVTVEKLLVALVTLSIVPFFVLGIAGGDLFSIVFGPQWTAAGLYVQLLSAWVFLVFVSTPLSTIFDVLEKQRVFLGWNILLFVTRVAAMLVGGIAGSPKLSVALFGFVGVLDYTLLIGLIVYYSCADISRILAAFSKPVLVAAPFCILLYIIGLLPLAGVQLLLLLGIMLLIYYGVLFKVTGLENLMRQVVLR